MSGPGDWRPRGVDARMPNVARMYDYYLGGKDHYAIDREAAEQALGHIPRGREMVTENRRFLHRAVRFLAGEAGIRQFIDIGSGLPTARNVHQIAQEVAPDAHVVYVDNDPVVLSHARALLASDSAKVGVVDGDMRYSSRILADAEVRRLVDFTHPVAVLLVAVLHFLTEHDDPYSVVRHVRSAIPGGSYLVMSHVDASPEVTAAERAYDQATSPAQGRTYAQIEHFFTGFELVDPGLVYVQDWRPDGNENPGNLLLGGIGYKPENII